jgi:hypothetical protein
VGSDNIIKSRVRMIIRTWNAVCQFPEATDNA